MVHKKVAVVLMNLGGPDKLSSVKGFLFNLFYDPLIIRLPNPFRWIFAKSISCFRNKKSQCIYSHIGGKSPILENTISQQKRMQEILDTYFKDSTDSTNSNTRYKTFTCMRYWHPMSQEVSSEISKYNPDEIFLLPMYPQFSTTTTLSSVKDFISEFKKLEKNTQIKILWSYNNKEYFVDSYAKVIIEYINVNSFDLNNGRILFSAHGLPVKIIKQGDPYQIQVEETVSIIAQKISNKFRCDLDYKITYQSRVGPTKWLTPNTEDEIELAGREGRSLLLVPISFVSEHVETLVELDIDYKLLAGKYNIKYMRSPTLGDNEQFIKGLAKEVIKNTTWYNIVN